MAIVLDGKKLAEKILDELKDKIEKSLPAGRQGGKRLKLAAILVGEDKNSLIFLKQKERACSRVGIDFQLYRFPENISQDILAKEVEKIGSLENHGIIVQLPLPKKFNTQKILSLIPAEKDVDCLSGINYGKEILPPVLAGVLEIFKEYEIDYAGKNVVVVGRGRLVGKPVSEWMGKHGAKVFAADEKTRDISEITKKADILVSGVGKPNLIKGSMVKEGAVVVDAAGDVDFKSASLRAAFITPVPGGVGPMTVAMVIKNLLILNSFKN